MLDLIRLLFDFGTVVLIWLVQLVIYPSFKYFSREAMRSWHPKYTYLVSFVVMPLMLGQIAVAMYQLYLLPGLYTVSTWLLIAGAWVLTFLFAVPLHHAIDNSEDHLSIAKRLIFINGWRTVLWTFSFLISLIYFLR